jgi:hypothetical protein
MRCDAEQKDALPGLNGEIAMQHALDAEPASAGGCVA